MALVSDCLLKPSLEMIWKGKRIPAIDCVVTKHDYLARGRCNTQQKLPLRKNELKGTDKRASSPGFDQFVHDSKVLPQLQIQALGPFDLQHDCPDRTHDLLLRLSVPTTMEMRNPTAESRSVLPFRPHSAQTKARVLSVTWLNRHFL